MNSVKIAVTMLILGAGLAACTANTTGLYSSGDYYNSYGTDYHQPYQDGSSYHYHHSYYANAEAVSEVGE